MKPAIRNLWKVVGATLLGALATTACDGTTVVYVDVEARATVRPVTQIEVRVSNDGTALSQTFDVSQRSFPLSLTVTPVQRDGELRVDVVAISQEGGEQVVQAQGRATVGIDLGDRVDAKVMLEPVDFVVNTDIVDDQILALAERENGRQLAVAPDGSFLVTFLNERECLRLDRCDVFARRFAANSAPARSDILQTTDEFTVNQSNEPSAAPAVATSQSGNTLAVWTTGLQIRGALLSNTGAYINEQQDLVISDIPSTTGELSVVDPHVSALADGQFIVVWVQLIRLTSESDYGSVIRGRLLNANGEPVTNPLNGGTGSFLISESDDVARLGPNVAATGELGGFVVVWQEGVANLAGRFFAPDTAPLGPPAALTNNDSGINFTSSVAWVDGAAFVAWDFFDADPRYENTALLLRRFAPPGGQSWSSELILVPNFGINGGAATMAVRQGDNALGVAWSNCEQFGDDSGCGVFLQMLFPSGLRYGQPFVATTTTINDQKSPSLAATRDAFVLAWTDLSQTAPDASGASVRARVLYPEFNAPTGVRGAPCGGNRTACEAGLVCMRAEGEDVARCHDECDNPGSACPEGGECTIDAEVGRAACTFPPR